MMEPSSLCHSFPPAAKPGARALILGSMPGVASLHANQYYAHPRNLFWPFMGVLLGATPDLPYEQRLARLNEQGVALWDVLASCERAGSLDGSIARESEIPNDFATLLASQPKLERICLNGSKAAQAFERHVAKPNPQLIAGLQIINLPSTSPANAGKTYEAKLAAWSDALKF